MNTVIFVVFIYLYRINVIFHVMIHALRHAPPFTLITHIYTYISSSYTNETMQKKKLHNTALSTNMILLDWFIEGFEHFHLTNWVNVHFNFPMMCRLKSLYVYIFLCDWIIERNLYTYHCVSIPKSVLVPFQLKIVTVSNLILSISNNQDQSWKCTLLFLNVPIMCQRFFFLVFLTYKNVYYNL